MAEITKIQWTDHTFNPWIGCTKVHTGCLNCYAEADMDKRRGRAKWGPEGSRSLTTAAYWNEPEKWARQSRNRYASWMLACAESRSEFDWVEPFQRPRVFCASLADVFEDWAGEVLDHERCAHYTYDSDVRKVVTSKEASGFDMDQYHYTTMNDCRKRLFGVIDHTPELDWLLLTKRPENIRRMMTPYTFHACQTGDCPHDSTKDCDKNQSYRGNVWLGTSVSDQATADKAVPELLKCRDLAPVLFLSVEPLVGPVDLSEWMYTIRVEHNGDGDTQEVPCKPDIDWVIVGGESGPNARPCNPTWAKDIVDQCRKAGVACFVKQLGGNVLDFSGSIKDKKGGNPSEWPAELRVREWPEVMQPV